VACTCTLTSGTVRGAGWPLAARAQQTGRGTLLKYLVEFSGVAITYLAVAKLSLALASVHPSATPIWPPTGTGALVYVSALAMPSAVAVCRLIIRSNFVGLFTRSPDLAPLMRG
jgi:hypothetical protein